MDENTNQTGCACGNTMAALAEKFKCAITRALNVVKDPTNIWAEIKAEPDTVKDVYKKYILLIAAIPPLGQLIQGLYSGAFVLGMAILSYVLALAMVWLMSYILKALSPKFDGTGDQSACLKLLAYSSAPVWLGGIFYLVPLPMISGLIVFLCLLYSVYVLWQGTIPMLGVPAEKRLVLVILTVVIYIVLSLVLALLAAPFIIALNFGTIVPS